MALFYTIDEFIETLTTEIQNLDTYLRLRRSVVAREAQMLSRGDTTSLMKTELGTLLTDTDTVLEEVETALGNITFGNYAYEFRVGNPFKYHHAAITLTPSGDDWTLTAKTVDDISASFVFDQSDGAELLNVGDKVEVFGYEDEFHTGLFEVKLLDAAGISIEFDEGVNSTANSSIKNITARLRER